MRILWFTNDPMPAVNKRLGKPVASGTGHWMPSLLDHLVESPDTEVEIATAYPGAKDDQFTDGCVRYFVIGQPKRPGIFFDCRPGDLSACAALVRERAPDIVHIHGTERFYGLLAARKLIQAPCVISIQGLLGACRDAFFGSLSAGAIWKANRLLELATRRGLIWLYLDYARAARHEHEILSGAKSFMGRTDWDRAHLKSVNPSASYYHTGELLRSVFMQNRWNLQECQRRTILFTKFGRAPYRGTELLLKAMLIVRRQFPDVKLRLVDHVNTRRGYDRFLYRTICDSELQKNVEVLGYLDAPSLATELCRTHVFTITSYVENSPNSLCEAMQVGVPCVATYAGGIPSLIEHRRTGLLVPKGDAQVLADSVMNVFRNDELAMRLSRAARNEALERHAPQRVLSQAMNTYNDVIANGQLVSRLVAV
ncbi:MAG: glycosyltransferase family 4 protein [Acidobacteriaceae bacterium]|nr:glycosyltransferase family 4 protein [Acidobacteriaceae bacterium]